MKKMYNGKAIRALPAVLLLGCGVRAPAETLNYGTFKPAKTITVTVMTDAAARATQPPIEDAITPTLRERTGVTAVVVAPPKLSESPAGVVTALVAGNGLPDILAGSIVPASVDAQRVLVEAGVVWDFSDVPTLRKLFPNFTRRVDQWGDLSVWYENERTWGGTHVRLTQDIAPDALRKLYQAFRGTTFLRRTINRMPGIGMPSVKYLRDDILTRIFPKARTDAAQEQFFIKSFNYDAPIGASDPYKDIPIGSLRDLRGYMEKAKEIIDAESLKDGAGRDRMLVAQLSASDEDASSLMWSGTSMYGYWWTEPPFRVADKVYYPFREPWVKDVLSWWNACYNDGLLDPELFAKKDGILAQEIARGRFAVFPGWGSWAADARRYAKEHKLGYGWRQLPTWWPVTMKNTYNDASNQWVTYANHYGASIVTKNVREEDLAQVCNWLDYHYSEEFDVLKSWGPATFYGGAGTERRFRAAYRDLENFQVYGVSGGRDGYYYGILANSPVAIDGGAWNWEIQIGNLSMYPMAPMYVYPRAKKSSMNYDFEMLDAWAAYYHEKQIHFFPQLGWSNAAFDSLATFGKIRTLWFTSHAPAIAKAVVGTPDGFEANYASYQETFRADGFDPGMEEYQAAWKALFDRYIRKYWKD